MFVGLCLIDRQNQLTKAIGISPNRMTDMRSSTIVDALISADTALRLSDALSDVRRSLSLAVAKSGKVCTVHSRSTQQHSLALALALKFQVPCF